MRLVGGILSPQKSAGAKRVARIEIRAPGDASAQSGRLMLDELVEQSFDHFLTAAGDHRLGIGEGVFLKGG